MTNKIEKWLRDSKFPNRRSIELRLKERILEGDSLRSLKEFLENKSDQDLKVSEMTVLRYIETLPDLDQIQWRMNNPRRVSLLNRLKKEITKFPEVLKGEPKKECRHEHTRTISPFELVPNTTSKVKELPEDFDEKHKIVCLDCGKLLGSFDCDEEMMRQEDRGLSTYEKLCRNRDRRIRRNW